MSAPSWQSVLDNAHSSLIAMQPEGIEAAHIHLDGLRNVEPDGDVLARLKQVRTAASNSAQLWRVVLPEAEALFYSAAGEPQAVATPRGISVTA
jgi:hypothetical protein